jgi:uncharacterized protein YeaO (DUF488 family)
MIQLKRIYDPPASSDGYRVLVDRVWPRGMTKRAAALDEWMKEIAPSTALRTWFNHRVDRWEKFRERYQHELKQHSAELAALRARSAKERVTLLYGAKDSEHNQAVALRAVLDRR